MYVAAAYLKSMDHTSRQIFHHELIKDSVAYIAQRRINYSPVWNLG